MKFLGKFTFASAGQRLGVHPDGLLGMGAFVDDDPSAIFLAYQDGESHWVLQCWLGTWVQLSAARAPNAWYPVLYAAASGANATRFELPYLDGEGKQAKFVFRDENDVAVSFMTVPHINPYCQCHFDVGAGPEYGTHFDLQVRAPGLDEILRTKSAAGLDLGSVGQARVNFSGVRFVGVDFREARLREAILDDAVFVRCDLSRAEVSGARLRNADMGQTWIAGSDFSRCDLTYTTMPPTPWSDVYSSPTMLRESTIPVAMLDADWSFLDLTDARIVGLEDADLDGLKAIRCVAPAIDLNRKSLRNADFSGSWLSKADFGGADLRAAVFCSSTLAACNFSAALLAQARFDPSPLFATETELSGARFNAADATGARFTAATLHEATFTRACLRRACFARAKLGMPGRVAATFSHAYLENACFDSSTLYGVDFSYATLFGPDASFQGVESMQRCNLSNAYMPGIDLGGNDLRGAHGAGVCLVNARLAGVLLGESEGARTSLAGAALQGACFDGARLDWADLSNAAVSVVPGVIPVRYCDDHNRTFPAPPAVTELSFNPTAGIDLESMGSHTICPNGFTVQENLAQHRNVYQMLTAPDAPTSWFPAACGAQREGSDEPED